MPSTDLAQRLQQAAAATLTDGTNAPAKVVEAVYTFLLEAAKEPPKASKLDEVAESIVAAWSDAKGKGAP